MKRLIAAMAFAVAFSFPAITGTVQVSNVKTDFGAVGDCVADDTVPFQNAQNAVAGGGVMYVPLGCYRVQKVNATGANLFQVRGDGAASQIKVTGQDAAGNWWDVSGVPQFSFRDLSIVDDGGTTIPKWLFPWACTGANCGTSGVLSSAHFDHVDIKAKTSGGFMFAYGFGNVGQSFGKGGSLKISDSTWTQTNNGAQNTNPSARNSCLNISGTNSIGVQNVAGSIPMANSLSWGAVLDNWYCIDNPPGYAGSGSMDANAALIVTNSANFKMNGGSLQCLCDSDLVIWANNQGLHFDSVQFLASDGAARHVNFWVQMGGGLNTFITFTSPFWSDPNLAFIEMGAATSSTLGGVWYLKVTGNNVAGDGNAPYGFIAAVYGCGPFTPSAPWIKNSYIQTYLATGVTTCGSIDGSTIFQGSVSITKPAGATDTSHKF